MEKISDFLKDFLERLSSPLFASFVIAWVFFNWQVPVALLFYSFDNLKADGYKSYNDLIIRNVDTAHGITYPLISAFGYCFIFPLLKNLILATNAWYKAWGSNWNIKISKTMNVPITKYLEVMKKYENLQKELQEEITAEKVFKEETEKLKSQLASLVTEKDQMDAQLQRWRRRIDKRLFDGEWEYMWKTTLTAETTTQRLVIQNGFVSEIIFNGSKKEEKRAFVIEHLCYNPDTDEIMFIRSPMTHGESFHIQRVKFSSGFKLLEGVEDERINVSYKKIDHSIG